MTNERQSNECLQQGNKCSLCLDIARQAFRDVLSEGRPGSDAHSLAVLEEGVNIRAVVEGSLPLSDLSCEERQIRARTIGVQISKAHLPR